MHIEKQWVFKVLVKRSNDPHELIAYSLYKKEKDELADNLIENKFSSKQIASELRIFHDQVLRTESRLQGFRDKAVLLLKYLITDIEKELHASYMKKYSMALLAYN